MSNEKQIFDAAAGSLHRTVNLIEASAGTGKTYAIAMLVLRLITEFSLKIDSILLVTFTRAATEELAERIRVRLTEARDLLAGASCSEDITLQSWADNVEQRSEALLKIENALLDIDRASVFTIHGFCQRMLKELALESGQLFDVELQPDAETVRLEAAQDFWREHIYFLPRRHCGVVLRSFPTPGDLYASVAPVTANCRRIEPEVEDLEKVFSAFDVAFTAMADWWQKRGDTLLESLGMLITEGKVKKEFVDTFSTWSQSLDEYFQEQSFLLPLNLEWLESRAFVSLLNGTKLRGNAKAQTLDALALPDVELSAFIAAGSALLLQIRRRFASYLLEETEKRLQRKSAMSYDDLIVRLHRAVHEGKNLVQVIRQRYDAALIDEFQDTDGLQWGIFNTIFGGGEHFLYLIGDPKQAIYGFRGADIYSYFKAKHQAEHHLTLQRNYRSHPGLVAAVNDLFQSRRDPFFFDPAKLDFSPVEAARGAEDGFLANDIHSPANMIYCSLPPCPDTSSGQWSSGKASTAIMADVSREIVSLLNSRVMLHTADSVRPLQPGDIAILVRTNRQAEEFRHTLAGAKLPAVVSSKISVYSTEECRELYQVLQALAEPGDIDLLKKAMTVKWFGLNGDELYRIWQDPERFDAFQARFQNYTEIWLNRGVLAMMRKVLQQEDILRVLRGKEGGERKIANIEHLLELLQDEEADSLPGPLQLLQWLQRNMNNETGENELRLESDDEAVRLVTMHGCKGLEYPVVFCPFLWYRRIAPLQEKYRLRCHEDGDVLLDLGSEHFEERRQQAMDEEMAEEMRLLYVAVTRAKYKCYTFWCDTAGRINGPADSFDSGLGYLLFPDGRVAYEEQEERLNHFCSRAETAHMVVNPESAGEKYTDSRQDGMSTLACMRLQRSSFHTNRQMTSYSALAAGSDFPSFIPTGVGAGSLPEGIAYAALPSGAGFGNLVHDIFEELPFAELRTPQNHRNQVKELCRKHGLELNIALLEDMLQNVVTAPLPQNTDAGGASFALADINQSRCLKETPFYYHLKNGDTQRLSDILAEEETVLPLAEKNFSGFLTGFVDLLFQYGESFYIVDYKTNYLGDQPEDYRGTRLVEAMASHNYGLQLWLYSVVLHRHLQNVVPEYDHSRHFGGVFYLFVRGMAASQDGIYYHKPALQKLERLSALSEKNQVK
ncbi:MAG: exodeoxyribonuclease V subunit beta [Desulfopila sp.]|nr:exodeoxyribonuclease V subunit beta [Desulfopila sp.]